MVKTPKLALLVGMLAVIFVSGCVSSPTGMVTASDETTTTSTTTTTVPTTTTISTTTTTESLMCPASCDDMNRCTKDYCSESTNYECRHDKISPCADNGVCEEGEYNGGVNRCDGSFISRMGNYGGFDCPRTCDDSDSVTADDYNFTAQRCEHYKCEIKSTTNTPTSTTSTTTTKNAGSTKYKIDINQKDTTIFYGKNIDVAFNYISIDKEVQAGWTKTYFDFTVTNINAGMGYYALMFGLKDSTNFLWLYTEYKCVKGCLPLYDGDTTEVMVTASVRNGVKFTQVIFPWSERVIPEGDKSIVFNIPTYE